MNLLTSLGDVTKRAFDLVVIPQSKADISGLGLFLKEGGYLKEEEGDLLKEGDAHQGRKTKPGGDPKREL